MQRSTSNVLDAPYLYLLRPEGGNKYYLFISIFLKPETNAVVTSTIYQSKLTTIDIQIQSAPSNVELTWTKRIELDPDTFVPNFDPLNEYIKVNVSNSIQTLSAVLSYDATDTVQSVPTGEKVENCPYVFLAKATEPGGTTLYFPYLKCHLKDFEFSRESLVMADEKTGYCETVIGLEAMPGNERVIFNELRVNNLIYEDQFNIDGFFAAYVFEADNVGEVKEQLRWLALERAQNSSQNQAPPPKKKKKAKVSNLDAHS